MAVEQKPLMPKATAVWLVDNTGLSFEQIADFCGLHPLEVKGIADEDVAKGEIAGIEGTPSFFINGRAYTGNPTVAGIAQALEEELKL